MSGTTTTAVAAAVAPPSAARGPVRVFFSRLVREKPVGAAAALLFLLFVFCGVFAEVLAPYGYNEINMLERLKAPSWAHPFGTDNLGRDMLSRCLYGAQLSVIIGLSAAALATIISVLIGLLSGYLGGKVDMIVQRIVDAYMSFPELVILICLLYTSPSPRD